jgi:chromosomal replication initiation ATPase DnaA
MSRKGAGAQIKYQLPAKEQHQNIDEIIKKVCKKQKITIEKLRSGSRRKDIFRGQIAIDLVKKYWLALAEIARRVGVSTSAISKIMQRANK